MSAVLSPEIPQAADPQGDEKFAMWIAPEIEFVHRVSRRFSRSRVEGEDLAQEVLTRAYRGIDGFDGRYPRAWLHRIISNSAASRARRKRVIEVSLDATMDTEAGAGMARQVLATDPEPATVVIDRLFDPLLESAMEGLAPHFRHVIDLVDLGGASYEEAAAQLDVPIGTVMSRLHRGRGKLRNELAGSHLDRSASMVAAPPV